MHASERPRLLDPVREAVRRRHYSLRTEEPTSTGSGAISVFPAGAIRASSARRGHSVSEPPGPRARRRCVTQNQALSALLFLYREVLGPLPWLDEIERAKSRCGSLRSSRREARRLLAACAARQWLMASLLYGAGLRLRECLR